MIPIKPSIHHWEQSINNVILLKQYVKSIHPIYEALGSVTSELLLSIFQVRAKYVLFKELLTGDSKLCAPEMYVDIQTMIDDTINEDIAYQNQPLDLRNQRTYAVKVSRLFV